MHEINKANISSRKSNQQTTTKRTHAMRTANTGTNTARSHRRSTHCTDARGRARPVWERGGNGGLTRLIPLCVLLLFLQVAPLYATAANTAGHSTAKTPAAATQYSQPIPANGDGDSFRPIIPSDINPEYISRNVFTQTGQYRVFEPVESDLRAASTIRRRGGGAAAQEGGALVSARGKTQSGFDSNEIPHRRNKPQQATRPHANVAVGSNDSTNTNSNSDMQELEQLLTEYVENFFTKGQYEPSPALVGALQHNRTERASRRQVRHTQDDGRITVSIPRAIQSGRLLLFAGLKKVLWPVFMGLQILKSLLFALFLPTLIGSFGKLLGKGIISGSAPIFIRPMEAPQEVDFKDNSFNFDEDNKFTMQDDTVKDEVGYAYNQAEASQQHNQYAYNAAAINQQALSRYGNEQQKTQDSYLSALQSISSGSFKNSNSISGGSSAGGLGAPPMRSKPAAPANINTFQTFQKVPATSLLLSNYDPFYSPLLSRLDSVFAQLKLNSENEACREKLICLMYSNPAKYAPYSNLMSAQLSRELNELRKPTSDNPDILRFFKYMRAAKDGQDGVDCEEAFDGCKEFKDFENPAMVSTYNDINKLVQARKMRA